MSAASARFQRPSHPVILCWFYAPPVPLGPAFPLLSPCSAMLVGRWPCVQQLEAYQVRLAGYMITNYHDRFCPVDACFDTSVDDFVNAGRAGGVW